MEYIYSICKGKSCSAVNGRGHSEDCIAEHEESSAPKFNPIMALAAKCNVAFKVGGIVASCHPNQKDIETFASAILGKHVLYKTGDRGVPAQICDGNGEVVLAMCKLCGKAESELDMNARCKPRVKL